MGVAVKLKQLLSGGDVFESRPGRYHDWGFSLFSTVFPGYYARSGHGRFLTNHSQLFIYLLTYNSILHSVTTHSFVI
jgi:hypothetical protein